MVEVDAVEHVVFYVPTKAGEHHPYVHPGHHHTGDVFLNVTQHGPISSLQPGQVVQIPAVCGIHAVTCLLHSVVISFASIIPAGLSHKICIRCTCLACLLACHKLDVEAWQKIVDFPSVQHFKCAQKGNVAPTFCGKPLPVMVVSMSAPYSTSTGSSARSTTFQNSASMVSRLACSKV